MSNDKNTSALLLIDLQNDFCPGGRLAVAEGDAVMAIANQLMPFFEVVVATQDWHPAAHASFASSHLGYVAGDVITLNEHTQILWPDHCVQNSHGAAFHPTLNQEKITQVFRKGVDKNIDSYSAFYDNKNPRGKPRGILFSEYMPARETRATAFKGSEHALPLKNPTCKVPRQDAGYESNHHVKSTGLTRWLHEKNISTLFVMGLATDYCVKYSCLDAIADGFSVYLIQDGCRGVNLQPCDVKNALHEMKMKGVQLITSHAVKDCLT